jgi:enoyl-CoA hydratase/carnithine racemase
MTGRHVPAPEMEEYGVVNDVHADDDLDEAVEEFAEELASKPPLSIQAIKKSANLANQVGLREGREYDRKAFEPLLATDDHAEGAKAFAEDDYEPEFKGK